MIAIFGKGVLFYAFDDIRSVAVIPSDKGDWVCNRQQLSGHHQHEPARSLQLLVLLLRLGGHGLPRGCHPGGISWIAHKASVQYAGAMSHECAVG